MLPHLHLGQEVEGVEGGKTSWHRSLLLVSAITLHNFPEGLAIGVAFDALGSGATEASLAGAMALALGIGLQNFPEGRLTDCCVFFLTICHSATHHGIL